MSAFTHPMISYQSETIRKPDLDDRSYRHLVLRNGMEALLISDPTTDLAAAAVDVNVGHFSDPDEFPGLAHFLEHMLFMGSETYPDENAYSRFLAENGGHSNAFTATESTNYYFDVKHDKFKGALDRFAPFFTCPLLSEGGTDREMLAVDSENKKNLLSDMWRNYQLAKSTSNPAHPFSKFGTGSLETLGKVPRSKGLDTRTALLDFHKRYYSANLMRAVLIGRESLDTLAQWAVDYFAAVPTKNVAVPTWQGHPYEKSQLQRVIFTKPVKELRNLEIAWALPDLFQYDSSKPGSYWSHLLGHEGKGSLLSHLKEKGWATSLGSSTHEIGKGSELFEISVELTPQGAQEWQTVLKAVFAYIQRVLQAGGVQEWIFEETKALHELSFRFMQKDQPSSYASSIAGRMQKYGSSQNTVDKILSGKYLLENFDPEPLRKVLRLMTWENCAATLVAPEAFELGFNGKINAEDISKEKWYGTEYVIQPFPDALRDELKQIASGKSELKADFALPVRNEFVPESLETKGFTKQELKDKKLPVLISKSGRHRLFWKRDDEFGQPKANVQFSLQAPQAFTDARSAVLSKMFVKCVRDSLVEYTYSADLAGLSYSFEASIIGFVFATGGFSDKQPLLVEKLVREIRGFKVNGERFAILKEQLERRLRNMRRDAPYEHARCFLEEALAEKSFTNDELLVELEKIKDAAELQQFIENTVFQKVFIEGLIMGNVEEAKANAIMETVLREWNAQGELNADERKALRSYMIPDGKRFVYERDVYDAANVNSAIQVYFPIGDDEDRRTRLLVYVLVQILSEPCFDTLRTKEQLGYIVSLHHRRQAGQIGVRVLVQSERPATYLEGCVDRFLSGSLQFLENLSDEEFANYLAAVQATLSERHKNLSAETQGYWSAIVGRNYAFRQRFEDAEHVQSVTKADIVDFFRAKLLDSAKVPKFSVHLKSQVPYKAADNEEKKDDWEVKVRESNTFLDIEGVQRERKQWKLTKQPTPAIDL